VFALPAYNHRHNQSPPLYPGNTLSDYQRRIAVTWGYILTSFTFSFCAQGFGFCTAVQLYWSQIGKRENLARRNLSQLIVFSIVILIGGVGTLILGSLVHKESGVHIVGGRASGDVYEYPPNVVKYANLTITSGVLLICYSLLGLATASSKSLYNVMVTSAVFLWLWLITAHVMTQMGLAGSSYAGSASVVASLATATVIAPSYFAYSLHQAEPKPRQSLEFHHPESAVIEPEPKV
jgi:hypothetical protein